MPILQNIRSCVRRKHGVVRRPTKVHFNVKINDAFKSENVASQLRDLLVHIAREGVAVTDLFRRPGNIQSIKKIVSDLEAGRPINWREYNFYTLANIAKRFLIHIEGGILGEEAEEALIDALDIPDIDMRNAQMKSIITSQPRTVQQLLTLLFGTWFRMIYHTEVNAMSVEAVAKSVAGSIFPSCTYSPEKVEKASKVMEVLIVGFASTELFGRELIDYFTRETNTSISRVEKFKYEFRLPKNIPRPYSTQMFRQMLIEESKKHGFDIIRDEVSKEEFERANQTMTLDLLEHQLQPSSEAVPSRVPLSTLQPTVGAQSTFDPFSPTAAAAAATVSPRYHQTSPTPGSPTLPLPTDENDARGCVGDRSHRIDRVQQYSEKRTCVTAARGEGGATGSGGGGRRDSTTEMGTPRTLLLHLGRQYDSLSEVGDFSEPQEQEQENPAPGVQPKVMYGSGFNSVKKRQLERLQRRSDWFLSPPAGLRNSGMMRVDLPSSPANPRTSSKVLRSENGADVGRRQERREEEEEMPTPVLRRKSSSCRLQQLQQTPVFSNVHVPSASKQFVLASSSLNEDADGNTLRLNTSPVIDNRSSPDGGNEQHTESTVGSQETKSDGIDGDFELETRYFVAVKYYGPEPAPSIRQALLSTVRGPRELKSAPPLGTTRP